MLVCVEHSSMKRKVSISKAWASVPVNLAFSGKVWELQHLCRLAIRKGLGVGRRRRIKELPLPRHLLNFLCALPIARSSELHESWDRTRTKKAESVRKRIESHTPKPNRQCVINILRATAHQTS